MASTKYHAIDKSIIIEGMELSFNIFTLSDSKKAMDCFKNCNSTITYNDMLTITSVDKLYVVESEYVRYAQFYKTFLKTPVKMKSISFEEKKAVVYENASQVVNDFFNDPESLKNYEASKEVIKNMVEIVLHNEFTVKSLLSIAEHDYYTHTHSVNVAIYSLSLGAFLEFRPEALLELGESALLHDLGKSKIDTAIINKNGKLTDKEFEKIKTHSALGYAIALKLGIKNKRVLDGIKHHHEKIDGSGYPSKLKAENIPYYARIIGVCDIFDALTSKRSYKEAMSVDDALILMKTKMKEHVDNRLLMKMIKMLGSD